LSSDCVTFLLKCKVTPLALSWCNGRLGLLVLPEYFVWFIVQ
jgi:hypothetical protein